jgi:hypothetical protein
MAVITDNPRIISLSLPKSIGRAVYGCTKKLLGWG